MKTPNFQYRTLNSQWAAEKIVQSRKFKVGRWKFFKLLSSSQHLTLSTPQQMASRLHPQAQNFAKIV
jgi:hypothetical protein